MTGNIGYRRFGTLELVLGVGETELLEVRHIFGGFSFHTSKEETKYKFVLNILTQSEDLDLKTLNRQFCVFTTV